MTKLPVTCECKVPYKKAHGLCLKHEGKCGKLLHAGFNPYWCANKAPCQIHPSKDYNSHTHCWDNSNLPCGIPIEKHTQCCLCDLHPQKSEQADIYTPHAKSHGVDAHNTEESWEGEIEEYVSGPRSTLLKMFIRTLLKEEKAKMVEPGAVIRAIDEMKAELRNQNECFNPNHISFINKMRKKVEELQQGLTPSQMVIIIKVLEILK